VSSALSKWYVMACRQGTTFYFRRALTSHLITPSFLHLQSQCSRRGIPYLLDMSSEPLEDEVECSDSDMDSDSDDESICNSISGTSMERLSIQDIQGHPENELPDEDVLTKAHGM